MSAQTSKEFTKSQKIFHLAYGRGTIIACKATTFIVTFGYIEKEYPVQDQNVILFASELDMYTHMARALCTTTRQNQVTLKARALQMLFKGRTDLTSYKAKENTKNGYLQIIRDILLAKKMTHYRLIVDILDW